MSRDRNPVYAHLEWTEAEEQAFAQIIEATGLSRIRAIQLWKRCRRNVERAIAANTQRATRIIRGCSLSGAGAPATLAVGHAQAERSLATAFAIDARKPSSRHTSPRSFAESRGRTR